MAVYTPPSLSPVEEEGVGLGGGDGGNDQKTIKTQTESENVYKSLKTESMMTKSVSNTINNCLYRHNHIERAGREGGRQGGRVSDILLLVLQKKFVWMLIDGIGELVLRYGQL